MTKDFKIYECFVHNNPEVEAQKEIRVVSVEQDRERACSMATMCNSFGLLPQGYC